MNIVNTTELYFLKNGLNGTFNVYVYVYFAPIYKIQGGKGREKLWGLSKFLPSGKRTAHSEQAYRAREGHRWSCGWLYTTWVLVVQSVSDTTSRKSYSNWLKLESRCVGLSNHCMQVFLKLSWASEALTGLVITQIAVPHPGVPGSVGLQCRLRSCISNPLPGGAETTSVITDVGLMYHLCHWGSDSDSLLVSFVWPPSFSLSTGWFCPQELKHLPQFQASSSYTT